MNLKKETKKTLFFLILFLVIIAIYFEINILIDKLKINDIDVTSQRIHSITDESIEKIKSINKNINIKLVNFENNKNYQQTENIIKQYNNINDKIIINYELDTQSTVPYVIIECDSKSQKITLDDLYFYKYSTKTYFQEEYNLVENTMTNAIINISTEKTNDIYFYLEKSVYSKAYMQNSFYLNEIRNMGNNICYLELSEQKNIPENCKCLVIPPLAEDISEEEKNIIINYINNGGNLMLLEESKSLLNIETPNFDTVMAEYGVAVSTGIVFEEDNKNIVNDAAGCIYGKINYDSEIFKNLRKNSTVCLIDTGMLVFKDAENLKDLKVNYTPIITASNEAFLRTDFSTAALQNVKRIDSDIDANNAILAAHVQKDVNENKKSNLIIFANSTFVANESFLIVNPITNNTEATELVSLEDNMEVILKSVEYLADNNNSVMIRKLQYDYIPTIDFIRNNVNIELLFGIPFLLIIVGYIIWRVRKNKK